MKLLLEHWNNFLSEEEQIASDKAKILNNAEKETQALVNKIQSATQGDEGLARETLESIIQGLQQALERL
jgi:hypothetical protein|tara:strand:- start:1465 stop:1674 length:210 start_codon:yes stop_codon:yes gene_type:complete